MNLFCIALNQKVEIPDSVLNNGRSRNLDSMRTAFYVLILFFIFNPVSFAAEKEDTKKTKQSRMPEAVHKRQHMPRRLA